MNRILLVGLFFSISLAAMSQSENTTDYDYLDSYYDSTVYIDKAKQERKVNVNTTATMGYSFSSNGYGGPFMAISPNVSYPLNDRFSLTAGVSFGYGNLYSPYYYNSYQSEGMLPMTQMFLYASGLYKVSDKLTVNATVYKSMIDVPNRNPDGSNNNLDLDSQGASVGFQYKLTPNITFGIGFTVTDQPGYGYYGPYSPVVNPYNSIGPNWW